ncbi:MAG: 5-methyltetrahydropteroyltriglutamate--homocysteine methyltransferase [Hyphomicrobiales bacterium]|nr:5-methyltetrahydropteroyltriglutamate--homocysteine methyltransferase [Hyphomicrobiales bacterium]
MTARLLATTVVGSYPQPEWLVDRELLRSRLVPRLAAPEIWRVPEPFLEQAKNDATLLALRDMEEAGIDIISDGEIRRESYSNHFALALDGIDAENPAEVIGRTGARTLVPRVVGPIRRSRPIEIADARFLARNTKHATKVTLPGPFTLSQQAMNQHYGDEAEVALAYAAAVNAEARELEQVGIDVIQLDEPWLQARPEAAARFAVPAINRALEGLEGETVVHLCFGYAEIVRDKPSGYSFLPQLSDCIADAISIEAAQPKLDLGVLRELGDKRVLLGVLDLGSPEVESAEEVASRIRQGLKFLAPQRLTPAPDCGMKYLTRATALGKLKALAEGAALVRHELAG